MSTADLNQAEARSVAEGARRQWEADQTHGLIMLRDDPITLALKWADDWWADLHGWPVTGRPQSREYQEWAAEVHTQALALQQEAESS